MVGVPRPPGMDGSQVKMGHMPIFEGDAATYSIRNVSGPG